MRDAETCEGLLDRMARGAGQGPASLHVLVADRCNHACVHCYQVQGERGEMSREALVAALAGFRAAGGFVVTFSGGEATLRADLVELLDDARALGLATVLYTNAYLVDADFASRLARAGVFRVDVSVYSDAASEHDAVTRVPGSFERTMGGVRALRAAGVQVRLKLTTLSPTTADVPRMAALAASVGASLTVADVLLPREDDDPAPLALARAVVPDLGALPADVPPRDEMLALAPCGAGASARTLRSDGWLLPCHALPIRLADAAAEGADAFSSAARGEVSELFARLSWRDLHGCRDCALLGACARCHATSLAETGDMLGPHPSACAAAVARHLATRPGARALFADGVAGGPTGPYRVEPNGDLVAIPDVVLDRDRLLRERHPFVRPGARGEGGVGAGASGAALVALRRPSAPTRLDAPKSRD